MPPDALHSAARIETTRLMLSALLLLLTIAFSWSPMSSAALSGNCADRSSICWATVSGVATRP